MKIYREIDIQNPFTMCNILNDTAWSNCYLLQKKGLLDEVESILEETEMTEEQLNDFFAYDVESIFPDVFVENEDEVRYFAATLSRYWKSKDLQFEIDDSFKMKSGKEIFVISGSPFAKDAAGDYYEVDEDGEPFWYWMDLNTHHICDTLDVDHDFWMPFPEIPKKMLKRR